MKIYISSKKDINAGLNVPNQGIFWYIDGNLLSLYDPVDIDNFVEFGYLTHKDTWRQIKSDYTVDGKEVGFDYYPRGRVIVNPDLDDNGNLTSYECYVYGDKCILYDKVIQDMIEEEFRLYLGNCNVYYEDQLSLDETHYTCHNCR